MTLRPRSKRLTLLVLLLLAVAVLAGAPFIGMKAIHLGTVLRPASSGSEADILWRIRIPRVFIAFLAGAGCLRGAAAPPRKVSRVQPSL